jgi:3-phosphoglycerate kinase
MSNQPERTLQELRQALLAECDATKQVIAEISDEELVAIVGGLDQNQKTMIGTGVTAGAAGAVLGGAAGNMLGYKQGKNIGQTLGRTEVLQAVNRAREAHPEAVRAILSDHQVERALAHVRV